MLSVIRMLAVAGCVNGLMAPAAEAALVPWLKCAGCTANSATQIATAVGPDQPVVVYDAGAGIAWRYLTRLEVTGGPGCQPFSVETGKQRGAKPAASPRAAGCGTQVVADPQALTSEDQAFITALHEFYVATGGTMKGIAEVDAADLGIDMSPGPVAQSPSGPTAVDFINNAEIQRQVENGARRHINELSWGAMWNAIASAAEIVLLGDDAIVQLRINFPDGSFVLLEFDHDRVNPEVVEAADAEGRVVISADNIHMFAGSLLFATNGNASDWLNAAEFFGVQIVGDRGSRAWTCTWDGNALTCRPI